MYYTKSLFFFLYSWKWKEERQDDNDTFPKNCAICGKTSRGVPTVACDFCPLVYHLDCLDPPLCEIPTVSLFFDTLYKSHRNLAICRKSNKRLACSSANLFLIWIIITLLCENPILSLFIHYL